MELKSAQTERAIFAGGCFWCMEPPFEGLNGVLFVTSGYCGGWEEKPTYEQVSSGTTGHAESVEVVYDPAKIDYEKLLEVFWLNVDPTDEGGQFVDRGPQYRTAIFYLNQEQKRLALKSKEELEKSPRFAGKKIVTEITAATVFWPAEAYHQHYYKKNPLRYKCYRLGSGRDQALEKLWGKQ